MARYVFMARDDEIHKIEANNLKQAVREFMENHVIVNVTAKKLKKVM